MEHSQQIKTPRSETLYFKLSTRKLQLCWQLCEAVLAMANSSLSQFSIS